MCLSYFQRSDARVACDDSKPRQQHGTNCSRVRVVKLRSAVFSCRQTRDDRLLFPGYFCFKPTPVLFSRRWPTCKRGGPSRDSKRLAVINAQQGRRLQRVLRVVKPSRTCSARSSRRYTNHDRVLENNNNHWLKRTLA